MRTRNFYLYEYPKKRSYTLVQHIAGSLAAGVLGFVIGFLLFV
jgi:hypothetical protein